MQFLFFQGSESNGLILAKLIYIKGRLWNSLTAWLDDTIIGWRNEVSSEPRDDQSWGLSTNLHTLLQDNKKTKQMIQ